MAEEEEEEEEVIVKEEEEGEGEGEGEGDQSSKAEAKMSRKEKRKARKKMKRKQVRREAAEKEREEEERRMNDPEEQRRLKEAEEGERERAERERKAFEERERAWLEEMERRRKLEEEEEEEKAAKEKEEEEEANRLQVGKGNQCHNNDDDDDDDDWEYVEEGPAEIIWQGNEIIVRKKKVKVPKKNSSQLSTEEDANRPISNPLPPQSEAYAEYQNSSLVSAEQMLENVAQQIPNFGTEQDKAHCPFHLKTGACRFGQRCSRVHFYPDKACTLLIKNMYNGPGLSWEQDEGLEYTDEEVERCYEEFYEDVHTEFMKYGELVNFKVCKNGSFHLRGNVYVHYKSLDSAVLAYHFINGRYFAGKQVTCEFVNVTRWKVAICGEYMKSRLKTCSHGMACNFIHCFRNPGGDYEWADWDKPAPRYWVKKMAALFGNSDEFVYEKSMEPENLKSASKRRTTDAGRHRARSRSQDMNQLILRSSSVAEDDVWKGTHHHRHVNDYRKRSKFLNDEENPRDHHHGGSRKYDSGSDEGCLNRDVGRGRERYRCHGHARKRSKLFDSEEWSDSGEKGQMQYVCNSSNSTDGASFDDGDRTDANNVDGYKDLKKHLSREDRSSRLRSKASLDASAGTGEELCRDKDKHKRRQKRHFEKNLGNQETIGRPMHEYHDTCRRNGSDSSDDQFDKDKKDYSRRRQYSGGSSEVLDEGGATLKRLRENSPSYITQLENPQYRYKSYDSDLRYHSIEDSVMEDRWEPQNHETQYDWGSEPLDSIGDNPDNGRIGGLCLHKSAKQSCERGLDSRSNFALDEGYYLGKSTSLDRKSSGFYEKSRVTGSSHRRSKKHSRTDETRTDSPEERQEVDENEKKHCKHQSRVGKDPEKEDNW